MIKITCTLSCLLIKWSFAPKFFTRQVPKCIVVLSLPYKISQTKNVEKIQAKFFMRGREKNHCTKNELNRLSKNSIGKYDVIIT